VLVSVEVALLLAVVVAVVDTVDVSVVDGVVPSHSANAPVKNWVVIEFVESEIELQSPSLAATITRKISSPLLAVFPDEMHLTLGISMFLSYSPRALTSA
jgi:hypothetical protein